MKILDKERLQDIKKYSYIFLWTQLFPILIYILNGYKNIGGIEVIKNLKAGIRICFITYIVFIIFTFLLGVISKKLLKIVALFLIFFNLTVNIFDLYAYINFGTQINSDIFFTVLETNINEGKEFLLNYINIKIFIILIYIFWILILIKFNVKKLFSFIGIIISLFFIIFYFDLDGTDYTRKYVLETLKSSYSKYQEDAKSYKETLKNLKDFNLKDEMKDLNQEDSTYVLIIGESSSKYHNSLYDYFRNTSPNLEKLKVNKELFIFNNIITPNSTTRETLQKVLTLKDSENGYNFYEVPSIIDLFKGAGFKTYWISNQESYGAMGNAVAAIASKADYTKYTEEYNYGSRKFKKFDETLISMFENILKDNAQKKFIVIHMMGNHMQYKERYPEKFKYYKDKNNKFNNWQLKNLDIVNSYDNSMLYTDYIISEIINEVKKENKKSYVLYFSDHGEELYDGKNFMGHGENIINKYVAEVPFILWTSDKYRLDNEKMDNILKSLSNKYTTEDLPYTLLDLSDIYWKNFVPEKSLINVHFKEKLRLHNNIDFDSKGTNKN